MLVSLEGSSQEPTFPRLGFTLAPAYLTMAARRAAGLPETAGLLIRAIEPASRADQSDAAVGDVLVKAGQHDLRSIAGLYAAINRAGPAGTLTLRAIRGEKTAVTITLDLSPRLEDDSPPGNTAPHHRTRDHQL